MEYGMPFLLETDTIEEYAKVCTSLNLKFIELNMNFPQCQLLALTADRLNEIKKENNIYFTIHLDENLNPCDFNATIREAYIRTTIDIIELAKQVQAPIINMHLSKGVYITLPDRKVYLLNKFVDEYMANLRLFRDACDNAIGNADILIAIENTNGFIEHEKAAIELLLESKHFGLTLDIGHSHSAGDIDIGFYQEHIDRLVHMHAHDAVKGSNHLAFGEGEIDLAGRLQLAKSVGARVVVEVKTIESLTLSVRQLAL